MAIARSAPGRQQGMALIMGLIILLVMTLVSISAMRGTMMQERMTGAFAGQQLAFQAAEAALRQAERELSGSSIPIGSAGYFEAKNPNREPPDWEDPNASPGVSNANPVGDVLEYDARNLEKVARQPQYFAEKMKGSCEKPDPEAGTSIKENSFRIMARGFGTNENTQVVLEVFYCR